MPRIASASSSIASAPGAFAGIGVAAAPAALVLVELELLLEIGSVIPNGGATVPVFVIAPQYQKGQKFNNPTYDNPEVEFLKILHTVEEKYPVDPAAIHNALTRRDAACRVANAADDPQGQR